jgi:hypothetical protein
MRIARLPVALCAVLGAYLSADDLARLVGGASRSRIARCLVAMGGAPCRHATATCRSAVARLVECSGAAWSACADRCVHNAAAHLRQPLLAELTGHTCFHLILERARRTPHGTTVTVSLVRAAPGALATEFSRTGDSEEDATRLWRELRVPHTARFAHGPRHHTAQFSVGALDDAARALATLLFAWRGGRATWSGGRGDHASQRRWRCAFETIDGVAHLDMRLQVNALQ